MVSTIWSNSVASVRGRLLIAFLGICALAAVSAAAALIAFDLFRTTLIDVTQDEPTPPPMPWHYPGRRNVSQLLDL